MTQGLVEAAERPAAPTPTSAWVRPAPGSIAWMSFVLRSSEYLCEQLLRGGIVVGGRSKKPRFGFEDLAVLRSALALVKAGLEPKVVSDSLRFARKWSGRSAAVFRFRAVAGRVVADIDGRSFEAMTGQLIMTAELSAATVHVLDPHVPEARARQAYALYLQASAIDEKSGTLREAQRLYEAAVKLHPTFGMAWTNLANVHYRRRHFDEAERIYRAVMLMDAGQAEARYNLGILLLDERQRPEAAISLFLAALERDPKCSDAHFNIAVAYERVDLLDEAATHWTRCIALQPDGPWADEARAKLRCRTV